MLLMQTLLTLSSSVRLTRNVIKQWLDIAQRRSIEAALWRFVMITAVIRIDAEVLVGSVGLALATTI